MKHAPNFTLWIVLGVFSFVVVFWFISPLILGTFINDFETKGQFGDSFGAVNSLFSGLAFVGVIGAIMLQRNELKLQREELALTREELSKSTEAQEVSGNYLGEQAQVMKVTAHLNGLAAIIEARTSEIEYLRKSNELGVPIDTGLIKAMAEERHRNIEELEALMHGVLCADEFSR